MPGFHGLICTGVLTYLHDRVVGDMPGRVLAELTTKVAKILKDPIHASKIFQKIKKAETGLANRTQYLHLTIDVCIYL